MHTVVQNGILWTVSYQYYDNQNKPVFSPLHDFTTQGEAADYCSWLNGGPMPMWGGPVEAQDRRCRTCMFWRVKSSERATSKARLNCQKNAPRGELVQGVRFTVWPSVFGEEGCGEWRSAERATEVTPTQAAALKAG